MSHYPTYSPSYLNILSWWFIFNNSYLFIFLLLLNKKLTLFSYINIAKMILNVSCFLFCFVVLKDFTLNAGWRFS